MRDGTFRNTFGVGQIGPSARRHGVPDADIRHAISHHLIAYDLSGDGADSAPRDLVIGPTASGTMIEIVVIHLVDERSLIIHAMALRKSYRHLLP